MGEATHVRAQPQEQSGSRNSHGGPLHQKPAIGISADRPHVGEIFRREAEPPRVPVEQAEVATAVARQEAIPDMRVAVSNFAGFGSAPAGGARDRATTRERRSVRAPKGSQCVPPGELTSAASGAGFTFVRPRVRRSSRCCITT